MIEKFNGGMEGQKNVNESLRKKGKAFAVGNIISVPGPEVTAEDISLKKLHERVRNAHKKGK
jgi:hypothetical protein